jgi:hypothetical protein
MNVSPTLAPQRAQTAWDVCRQYEPSKEALALLRKSQTSKAYFDLLVQSRLDSDAVAFLARSLTKQEAIWWGCLCAWDVARPNPTPAAQAALEATLRWLREPTEEHRRAAEQVARKVGVQKPAGAVAQAAVFATGSMSLPGLPAVTPPEDLTALTISGAIRCCAAELTAAGEEQAHRQLLRFGLEVATGKNRWL